jgi:ribosomal protein S18 acetylase RimI-like enzyme
MADSRDFAGERDMRAMQELARECWRREGPLVSATVGDPPWMMYQHLDKLREVDVRLWRDGGECVGWGWRWHDRSLLFFLVHPERRELVEEIVAWAETRNVEGLEHDRSAQLLGELGYSVDEAQRSMHHMVRPLDNLPEPELPAGYSLRTVEGDADLVRRVDVHRAAFAPSRVLPASYRQVMAAWPYRPDLDHVVVAPDGSFAAFCLCWLDEENAVGELEPVGTHPDHQRLGLATAVCRFALGNLAAAGADTAVVYSKQGYKATGLYEGLGFTSISRHLTYSRESEAGSAR